MVTVRRIGDLAPEERADVLERDAGVADVLEDAAAIVEDVQQGGDAAVDRFTREFDGVTVDQVDVTEVAASMAENVDADVMAAIRTAAGNIRSFHERQAREDWRVETDGRELGRRFRPIKRVGAYVPGGTAAYPSSALMTVIPAAVAGVGHVTVATPPAEELNPVTLAAIHEAGADRVLAIGGAQAVAALAYGTETIEPVEKVVGPGNRWVTAAKSVVRGDVDIDFLAGPSEVLVLFDGTVEPAFVAAELVAQAEHDPDSAAVAVTPDSDAADAVVDAVSAQIDDRQRVDLIRQTLGNDRSGVLVADSMDEAVEFAETYAPEHLSIMAEDDESLLDHIDSAGSVFLGPYTPVAAGDYASGTNHVLPTGGLARVAGGLSVDTFLRASTVQRLDREGLSDLRETITTLARAEGLDAHAASVDARFED